MNPLTQEQTRFFEAFEECMNQYPLSLKEYIEFANGNADAVSSETISALYDARNLWDMAHNPTTSAEVLAIKCAHADLVGALQAIEACDPHAHDWKAHKQSINDLEDQFSFIEKGDE